MNVKLLMEASIEAACDWELREHNARQGMRTANCSPHRADTYHEDDGFDDYTTYREYAYGLIAP